MKSSKCRAFPAAAVIALALASGACSPPSAPSSSPATVTPSPATADQQAITGMVERFRRGIIEHDRAALSALFVNDAVPFVNTRSGPKGIEHNVSTAGDFMAAIATAPHPLEERFTNLDVRVHDAIAVMLADYSFHENGVQTNHGRELWSLVRTATGWKVVSVSWTVIVP